MAHEGDPRLGAASVMLSASEASRLNGRRVRGSRDASASPQNDTETVPVDASRVDSISEGVR